jgi:hypothetical protein
VPVVGMERHFPREVARLRNVKVVAAPSGASTATTHPGFDDDDVTMASVISGMA